MIFIQWRTSAPTCGRTRFACGKKRASATGADRLEMDRRQLQEDLDLLRQQGANLQSYEQRLRAMGEAAEPNGYKAPLPVRPVILSNATPRWRRPGPRLDRAMDMLEAETGAISSGEKLILKEELGAVEGEGGGVAAERAGRGGTARPDAGRSLPRAPSAGTAKGRQGDLHQRQKVIPLRRGPWFLRMAVLHPQGGGHSCRHERPLRKRTCRQPQKGIGMKTEKLERF